MRKVAALFFICISLFGQTELHQLFKLPFLISHYQKHMAKDQQGLIRFLAAHYFQAAENKQLPDPAHHQLPFKSAESTTHPDAIFLLGKHDFTIPYPAVSVHVYYYFNEDVPVIAGKGIFHPPRC